jgi:D-alanine-D-alanine ligase
MSLAIIFGGKSFEHEISIVSTIALSKVLKQNITFIFLNSDREFYQIPKNRMNTKLFSSGDYKKESKLEISNNGFYNKSLFGTKKIEFDILLNLCHGGDGEDGKLASLFDFFGIKYIGPRVEASVLSCNKYLTKLYAKDKNVDTIKYQYIDLNNIDIPNLNISYPSIIKPAKLGSSIGVSIIKSADELEYALDCAKEYDDEAIIEPFYNGIKEYNLAGCKINGKYKLSIIEEPSKDGMLDFDKKYMDFNRTSKTNEADISHSVASQIKEAFKSIYETRFEGSLIRCDFFVLDEKVYLNEINSIPGSMANYLFDDFEDILNSLKTSLPSTTNINVTYEYVNHIQSNKK